MSNLVSHLARQITPAYEPREAQAIARLVAEERFGVTLAQAYAGLAPQLTPEQTADLEQIVQRLLRHEPVQYILGQAMFCGHMFEVGRGVLIPRPETEDLVGRIVRDEAQGLLPQGAWIDCGCGSGCIAVSLKLACPARDVHAIDLHDQPLRYTERNARRLGADIHVRQADMLHLPPAEQPYAALVSNPPYIPAPRAAHLAPQVSQHEPGEALFVPDHDSLVFYAALAQWAGQNLQPSGRIYLEADPDQTDGIRQRLLCAGFRNTEILADRFGLTRFVVGAR